jgi:hypothetical protein
MAVASTRVITITYAGELVGSFTFSAAQNSVAPGDIDIFSLALGDNTIPLPTGGSTPSGATIIPPTGNTQTLTLKGVGGDTGIRLNKVDPTSISFDAAALPANFILNAGGVVTGLRVVWT